MLSVLVGPGGRVDVGWDLGAGRSRHRGRPISAVNTSHPGPAIPTQYLDSGKDEPSVAERGPRSGRGSVVEGEPGGQPGEGGVGWCLDIEVIEEVSGSARCVIKPGRAV